MAQFLKDLLLNGYNGVKPIETIQKKNNLGQQVKDVVSAELSKTGKRVLFYKQLPTLYGSDLVRISTKGSVDPARTLAVNTSRYKSSEKTGGGFGRFIGNLLGGSANRPSDTIFPANKNGTPKPGASPVSKDGQPINGDYSGLTYAVEVGEQYVVSQEPAGKNALTGLLKGNPSDIARNAVGAITTAAKSAVRNVAVKALTSKRITNVNKLKKAAEGKAKESVLFPNSPQKKGSEFIKIKDELAQIGTKFIDVKTLNIKERHYLIDTLLLKNDSIDDTKLNEFIKQNTGNNLQYIKIKNEETNLYLLFPATITDVQDNMTPEWSTFKYVGSPFNTYRYTGVERKIGFDFRVYYIDNVDQGVMKSKLNLLRELVYPSKKLTTIKLNDSNPYKPMVFTPNTIELSIGDLYKNLKGFVSNLSITVPQDAPWAISNPDQYDLSTNVVYPTFVDVSFEMTIIENHVVDNDTITYRFDEVKPKEPNVPADPNKSTKADNSIPQMRGVSQMTQMGT
jgi:hypothetical protein